MYSFNYPSAHIPPNLYKNRLLYEHTEQSIASTFKSATWIVWFDTTSKTSHDFRAPKRSL